MAIKELRDIIGYLEGRFVIKREAPRSNLIAIALTPVLVQRKFAPMFARLGRNKPALVRHLRGAEPAFQAPSQKNGFLMDSKGIIFEKPRFTSARLWLATICRTLTDVE